MLFIILGIILYMVIGILVFYAFSRVDFFDEYKLPNPPFDFPVITFWASVFWILDIPVVLIAKLIDLFLEYVDIYGRLFYEKGKQAKSKKEKDI